MPCTSHQGVQLPEKPDNRRLPYGSLTKLSNQTGLSERTIRECLLDCGKRPRFRTAALLLLGQGFRWNNILQSMCLFHPETKALYDDLEMGSNRFFAPIPAYDPRFPTEPPFLRDRLSSCLYRILSQTETKTGKRRTQIVSEISVSARCSQSCLKKMLAGYCDWSGASQTHLEPSWPALVAFAKVCGCSRSDFDYLLSAAYPDLALAFWLRPSYAPSEGHLTAATEIENYMIRCRHACCVYKGLHNCKQCSRCSLPEIELMIRAKK